MTVIILRVAIFLVIAGTIFLGVRKIFRDWKQQFRQVDAERRARDLQERQRPDVVTLKRDKDGRYRPPDREE